MGDNLRLRFWVITSVLLLLAHCAGLAFAQTGPPPPNTYTLEEAVKFAVQNYPAVRAALERLASAQGGIRLTRTSYLPRADMLWQTNRASRNNIFGLLLPQSALPSISGPVLPFANNDSVWGSAGGVLLAWEPFDFGYRRALVGSAKTTRDRANAELDLTRFDVAAATVDAYFNLLAATQRVRAAEADLQRREILATSIHVLTRSQLRPGADASRADAELAAARVQLARFQQEELVRRAILAEILGVAGTLVRIDAGPMLGQAPQSTLPPSAVSAHPLAVARRLSFEEEQAKLHVLDRAYYPHFNLQVANYGRGSGANVDGTTRAGTSGLGLEKYNWAVGVTVTFSAFDIFSIQARKQIQAANERAEAARYDQTIQQLTGQIEEARATLQGAQRIAENTPIQLRAARDTETQSRARYQAGLATVVEAAEAQGLLVRAETEDALAKLAVWRGLALLAAAKGDMEPFLELLRKSPGGP